MAYKKRRRPPGGDKLARKLHVNKQMLIRFERDGLVTPERNKLGHRVYSRVDIQKIKAVIKLMDEGHTLEQIRRLGLQKAIA